MSAKGGRVVLGESPQHLGEEHPFRTGIVDIFGNGDQPHIMFSQYRQRFQSNLKIPGPAVQGMDDNDIKFMAGDVIKQFPKDWPAGDGIDVGRLPFFAVNMEWLPAPVFAEFIEEPLLGIQGMPFDLGCVRTSNIGYCFHYLTPLLFLDATARAVSAKVCRKCFTMSSSASIGSVGVVDSVYGLRIRVNGSVEIISRLIFSALILFPHHICTAHHLGRLFL